ncbi:MAG TPA: 3-oxoadipyl-CoA thiolase [Bacteroidales bacterium]|nr:3-oxoadipyl-CoA thiolase [Bacteroidales bacterium]
MKDVFICDVIRTPIGRYGGSLSGVRPDDLAATVIKALAEKNPQMDLSCIDDVIFGCANQAGEDNRNVARMALLLARMPETVPGVTINRLCGSGLDAVGTAARAVRAGEADLIIAGGVESMSRAPFVMEKSPEAFSRNVKLYDTTLGWRLVNPEMEITFGTDSMLETAENIASEFRISREDQDRFAKWSQEKTFNAQEENLFAGEIVAVNLPGGKSEPLLFNKDEHPRLSSLEKLAGLKPVRPGGTVTAGNASGLNDGAAALILASEEALKKHRLVPRARISGMAVAGVPPRIMGMGPVPATRKLLGQLKLSLDQFDIIELNEAFAVQVLGCTRVLGLDDNDPRINRLGGAIALGHPLGMSGTRLVVTAVNQLHHFNLSKALCSMCIGVGQGISLAIEKC